ncbi:MAG TPA: zinc-binding dehydrogenase [Candidatus Limnocylindria bacterium]|nr:zinc-binding dehydrogenase [Candidatus Limnocylindria bacterium]
MPDSLRGLRLRFAASALNERALRLLGPRLPRLAGGWMPWLSLARYAPPPLPGSDWVRVRPLLAGVCGTDLGLLTGHASSILSPFASFPAVLGHEVVGVVEDSGQRVVVDPIISCTVRGLDPCRWCAAGLPAHCERSAGGDLAPGLLIGYCADLPGGWSTGMIAHRSQLHVVPEGLSDEAAVLVEPFSVALHAVLANPPAAGDGVLVIGGGTLGLCTSAALRVVAPEAKVVVVARHAVQRQMAERLGATLAHTAVQAARSHAGARAHRSILGRTVLTGGFAQVYDAVGSRSSLADAMAVAAPRGRLILVGGPGEIGGLDWTLAWARELHIDGTYVYGAEPSLGGRHTMDEAMRLLVANPQLRLGELVTHRFRLEEWRQAMRAALSRGSSGAVKVAFRP